MRKTKASVILARALEIVNDTPYQVTLRWLFYELLQEGYYSGKKGYLAFKSRCADYRKAFKNGWRPDTIADDTRARIVRIGGENTIETCLENLVDNVVDGVSFYLDHFYQQENYVEIWFEARGMAAQFKYHTQGINLVPFGGDPSIPLKWETAKRLEYYRRHYDKDITVLYFGDYDPKGLEIVKSAEKDVREWATVDFELVRCGLTLEQIETYRIPENPGRPGQYQWEALPKEAAKEIIEGSLSEYLDLDLIKSVNDEAAQQEAAWKDKVKYVIQELVDQEED